MKNNSQFSILNSQFKKIFPMIFLLFAFFEKAKADEGMWMLNNIDAKTA